MGLSALATVDTTNISLKVWEQKLHLSVGAGRGVETVGEPDVGEAVLRKVSFNFIFWIEVAFLNTEGLAGVERGVGGVSVPSNCGVLCPVLLASVCTSKSAVESAGEIATSSLFSSFWVSCFGKIKVIPGKLLLVDSE